MMFNTPRVFVGSTTFLLAGMTSRTDVQQVTAAIHSFPGVRVVRADQLAGLITVTAERPTIARTWPSPYSRSGPIMTA